MSEVLMRKAEIKTRTTVEVKNGAKQVYSNWGLSLSDAINIFLVKSIEVGGLPFEMRESRFSHNNLKAHAYIPNIDSEGVVVLPKDWDDE